MPSNDQPDRVTAIAMLAQGTSSEAVGRELGIDGRRIRRWREDPAFEAEVQAARRAVLDEAVAALTSAVRDAVSTLHEALTDDSPGIRVRAASELIRALPALADHAVLTARIEALESRLDNPGGPRAIAA